MGKSREGDVRTMTDRCVTDGNPLLFEGGAAGHIDANSRA